MTKIFLSKDMGQLDCPTITIFDFETTTKEPATAEILTGYFKTVDAETGEFIEDMHVKMKPRKWVQSSFEFHGLSEELCNTFPDKKVMMREIFRYMKRNDKSLYICHANYSTFGIRGYFDWQVLKTECLYLDVLHHFKEFFGKTTIYSTHTMAKDRKLPLRNFGLKNVADYYGLEFKHHDCVEDTLVTEKIFWELVNTRDLLTIMEES